MMDVFTFTYNGHVYRCRNASGNVSAAGTARSSNAQWQVALDGVEVLQFPSAPNDTEESVRRRVTEWDDAGCQVSPKPVTAFTEPKSNPPCQPPRRATGRGPFARVWGTSEVWSLR